MKKYITILIIILLGVAVYITYVDRDNKQSVSNNLNISDITTNGDTLNIGRVYLEQPGYIVAKEVINSKPGQVVEISKYLSVGETTNVEIQLPKDQIINAVSVAQNGFPTKVELAVVVYKDDGDRQFNSSLDKPAVDTNGNLYAKYVDSGERVAQSAIVQTQTQAQEDADIEIVYTKQGFSPANVTIERGQNVRFINNSGRPMWVASNVHPGHTNLPTFDQFKAVGEGATYQYTFEQVGEWAYHDHVNASMGGVITVE